MRIAIIGGGAIGLLFAAKLSNSSNHVTVFTRTNRQRDLLATCGLLYCKEKKREMISVEAKSIEELQDHHTHPYDLMIICVKQYGLADIIEKLRELKNVVLLFIQNGMGHVAMLQDMSTHTILVGAVEHGVRRVQPNFIEHTGVGVTKIAAVSPRDDAHPMLESLLAQSRGDFELSWHHDYSKMLSEKLIANAVINPLTAVLMVKNGQLLEHPPYYEMFKDVCLEVANVLQIPFTYALAHVTRICENTANNESSMYKDMEAGRQTEIDAIVGYVLEEARRLDVKTPILSSLYQRVKGLENHLRGDYV